MEARLIEIRNDLAYFGFNSRLEWAMLNSRNKAISMFAAKSSALAEQISDSEKEKSEEGRSGRLLEKVMAKCFVKKKSLLSFRRQNEARILLNALPDHPNVVHLHDYIQSPVGRNEYLIYEYLSYGDLLDYSPKAAEENQIVDVFRGIVSGLQHCHQNGIAHRDLTCRNILISNCGQPKISDFGYACETGESHSKVWHEGWGVPGYWAPEIRKTMPYTPYPADTWSLGIILYRMLNGYLPFPDDPSAPRYQERQAIFYRRGLSYEVCQLLSRMLRFEPDRRPTCGEILEDVWFKTADPTYIETRNPRSMAFERADSMTAWLSVLRNKNISNMGLPDEVENSLMQRLTESIPENLQLNLCPSCYTRNNQVFFDAYFLLIALEDLKMFLCEECANAGANVYEKVQMNTINQSWFDVVEEELGAPLVNPPQYDDQSEAATYAAHVTGRMLGNNLCFLPDKNKIIGCGDMAVLAHLAVSFDLLPDPAVAPWRRESDIVDNIEIKGAFERNVEKVLEEESELSAVSPPSLVHPQKEPSHCHIKPQITRTRSLEETTKVFESLLWPDASPDEESENNKPAPDKSENPTMLGAKEKPFANRQGKAETSHIERMKDTEEQKARKERQETVGKASDMRKSETVHKAKACPSRREANTESAHIKRLTEARQTKPKDVDYVKLNRRKRDRQASQKISSVPTLPPIKLTHRTPHDMIPGKNAVPTVGSKLPVLQRYVNGFEKSFSIGKSPAGSSRLSHSSVSKYVKRSKIPVPIKKQSAPVPTSLKQRKEQTASETPKEEVYITHSLQQKDHASRPRSLPSIEKHLEVTRTADITEDGSVKSGSPKRMPVISIGANARRNASNNKTCFTSSENTANLGNGAANADVTRSSGKPAFPEELTKTMQLSFPTAQNGTDVEKIHTLPVPLIRQVLNRSSPLKVHQDKTVCPKSPLKKLHKPSLMSPGRNEKNSMPKLKQSLKPLTEETLRPKKHQQSPLQYIAGSKIPVIGHKICHVL